MSKLVLSIAALTALYSPANALNLTDEEIDNIQSLTKDEIDALAAAHPNTAQNNNYLLLFDKRLPADKQIYQLSSWQNLKELHTLGQHQFSPIGFRGAGSTVAPQPVTPAAKTTVDLSADEAAKAEGLKPADEANGDGTALVININGGASDNQNDGASGDSDTLTSDEQKKPLADLETELAQLQKDGAHHMKIKAVEKRIAELKAPQ